jgi:hypothetical protein
MQKFTFILLTAVLGTAPLAIAANYSTDATMSLQKDDGTYLVEVKIGQSRLCRRGKRDCRCFMALSK